MRLRLGITAAVATLGAVLVMATVGLVALPAAHAAALSESATITVVGHGNGHGHGMSQYGARGAALDGVSTAQILRFYYPGTKTGTASGKIRVWISEDTTRDLTVKAASHLVVTGGGTTWDVAAKHPTATRFQIVPAAGGKDQIQFYTRAWHTMATRKATLQFQTTDHAPLTLYVRGGTRSYHGALRAVAPDATKKRWTVNVAPLEQYVDGVVAAEMPASWPAAAVRAQAIAARSYAVFERAAGGRYYDICDTSACQVYGGIGAEQPQGNTAAKATKGKILTYRGAPALTQFAASNGGEMLAGSQPYLVSGKDAYEKDAGDPYRTWSFGLTVAEVMKRWPSAGKIESITLQKVAGTGGTWVDTVTITGTDNTYVEPVAAWDAWTGQRSGNFHITIKEPTPDDASDSPSQTATQAAD